MVSKETIVSKILITGIGGYVGSNLKKYFKTKGFDVYGLTSKETQEEKIYQVDITDPKKVFTIFNYIKPDIVIHTVALKSLNECEKNHELAMKINLETTKNIVQFVNNMDYSVKMVYFSSDYVFYGDKGNYKENDKVNPQTIYGKTKVLSENYITEYLENYIICRTANIYGRGGNFFDFILKSLNQHKMTDVFDDVFYSPTYIDYLLDSLMRLIEIDFKGIIHIAGNERISRYNFALKMANSLGEDKNLIRPIKGAGNLIANDSSLNCEYIRKLLQNYLPSVDNSLNYCFGNLRSPYCYFVDDRGKLIGVFQGYKWEEINFIESFKGCIRGNHYHKETVEGFFIVDGKIKVTLIDIVKKTKRKFIAKKGDILLINPNNLHTFEMLENSKWINMLSKHFNGKTKDIHI